MDLQRKGKTALIFGGSKGLGRGVADALAAEGVAVALVARGQEALDRAVSEITSRGGKAVGFAADLANWPSLEDAANAARKQLGPIDILLNNSGGPPPSGVVGVPAKVWEAQFQAMVMPLLRSTDLLIGDMRARKWGRILNIASTSVVEPLAAIGVSNTLRSAIVGWAKTLATETARDGITVHTLNTPSPRGVEPLAAIGVSNTLRSAIVGWAKTLATETARDGITVNTLLPGAIATDGAVQIGPLAAGG